jgi:hypothetical protein
MTIADDDDDGDDDDEEDPHEHDHDFHGRTKAMEKVGVQAAKFRVYKGVVVRLARADTRLQKYIFSGSSETIGQAKTDFKKLCSWHLGSACC